MIVNNSCSESLNKSGREDSSIKAENDENKGDPRYLKRTDSSCEEGEETAEARKKRLAQLRKDLEMSKVQSANINLEQTMISIGCANGFKLFELSPVSYKSYRDYVPNVGPVRIVRQMGRTNIIFYVSAKGGKYPANVAMCFDMEFNRDTHEITVPQACGEITNIQVCPNRLVVFTAPRIFVYHVPNVKKQLRSEETRHNPEGLSAMSYDPTTAACYLAYPGYKKGSVQIMNLSTLTERESKAPIMIEAHEGDITQIALNSQGTMLATGSTKGTIIRVFDARTKGLLHELRRGTVQAHLQCISFSPCSTYLAVASDKGTIHVFGIRDAASQKKNTMIERQIGSSSLMKWNMINRDVLALGFTSKTPRRLQSLVAICSDGTYWQHNFDKDNKGNVVFTPKADFFENLIELANDAEFFRTPI